MKTAKVEKEYKTYYDIANRYKTIMPDVRGLPIMDAVALLENMGLKVKVEGVGVVENQSISKGTKVKKNQTIVLKA